jgi:hypothetical protein
MQAKTASGLAVLVVPHSRLNTDQPVSRCLNISPMLAAPLWKPESPTTPSSEILSQSIAHPPELFVGLDRAKMLYYRPNGLRRVVISLALTAVTCILVIWSKSQPFALRETLQEYRPAWTICESSALHGLRGRTGGWESQLETGQALDLIETTRPAKGSYGFFAFDNLYARNGTFYIVTSQDASEAFPDREHIISRPVGMSDRDQEPTDSVRVF